MIGIDRYRQWTQLNNAVGDASCVLAAFEDLGFVRIGSPLLDDAATGDAIRCFPSILGPELHEHDSLIVFFAGHGHTTTTQFSDGLNVSKGYLIPVDADRVDRAGGRDHTWQRVEPWLTMIAELPPRHILVILDSCHSGIALSRSIVHRGNGVRSDEGIIPKHKRRSRRVLVSALDVERAMDGGPIAGHSVFTGYLIEALRGGARHWRRESSAMRLSDIAGYVCDHVEEYTGSQQSPELGLLEYDDCGELPLSLEQPRAGTQSPRPACHVTRPEQPHRAEATRQTSAGSTPARLHPDEARPVAPSRSRPGEPPTVAPGRPHAGVPELQPSSLDRSEPHGGVKPAPRGETVRLPDRTEGWVLDPGFAAVLDRQREVRRRGTTVLTIVAGDALAAQTSWGTWAAGHGYLTLATHAVGLDAVVADLLAQTPWLRCVPEARKRLAAAARIDVAAVDASLDARSISEQRTWTADVSAGDRHALVSGWLLSSLRHATASVPDLSAAPVRHAELLAIACDLASPTAVLLFHPTPDERWLERAVVAAAELIPNLPDHSIAVTAPDELVTRVLAERRTGSAWAMARQGLVRVDALAHRLPGRARHSTMRALSEALARDPRTRGRFERDGRVTSADGPAIDVALVDHRARIAVELDAWYHFHDPEGYRRDRVQDMRLQRAGYFVLRFPAEDVDDRLASTIEQLAIALASRRAVRAPL